MKQAFVILANITHDFGVTVLVSRVGDLLGVLIVHPGSKQLLADLGLLSEEERLVASLRWERVIEFKLLVVCSAIVSQSRSDLVVPVV